MDVVEDVVAYVGGVCQLVVVVELADGVGGFGQLLGGRFDYVAGTLAAADVDGGVEGLGGRQIVVYVLLRQVGGDLVEGVFVVQGLDFEVAVCDGVTDGLLAVLGQVDDDLVFLHGAVLDQHERFVQVAALAVDGVVEHDDAVVFQRSVDHHAFADAVVAAAVGALARQLVDEGVLRGLHAAAVLADGVALVDGQPVGGGIVEYEGLALVGVGGDGAVAQQLDFLAETDVHRAVGVHLVGTANQVVLGILGV